MKISTEYRNDGYDIFSYCPGIFNIDQLKNGYVKLCCVPKEPKWELITDTDTTNKETNEDI